MVKVYEINGVRPVVHPSAYVHPTAVLIGDVIVGPRCYVGPLASLRGDFGRLILEEGVNVQDTCVMHGFPGADTVVEVDGHIGHGAVLHGCRIGRNALVGMNAVVMDNAVVGAESIVAAMCFVKANMAIPPRSMVVGTPARIVREVTDEELAWKNVGTGQYHELAVRSRETMREVEAATEVEPDRQRMQWESSLPLHEHKKSKP
ncbi:phenylacetic acid degradation protein PaaY [Pseudoduganella buxea]|uniref:Phenylacetic acid degradation protein PaaY n=1 Tax=Pseudoduganella buxea TaxID=1949069 RepID=A0A6I3SSF0_9BURK|nr:phenylacetic acid degradation protein PaaY [Pseudoduganella buxea]MTV52011.1 phenylacetic acid degradation protein PaaY [Pseudoduganella buxea]GGB97951.1 phenylacetic acid degradation protein PaaY [Pseudoduganella buxea]